jgi:ParB-like chromosome segregation protein Spo0J
MKKNGYTPGTEEAIDITVVDGERVIIDGHHRARAAGSAGIMQVPVRIWDVSAETGAKLIMQAAEAAEQLNLRF